MGVEKGKGGGSECSSINGKIPRSKQGKIQKGKKFRTRFSGTGGTKSMTRERKVQVSADKVGKRAWKLLPTEKEGKGAN